MAGTGNMIEHPVTGEWMRFRKTAQETNGELLQIELRVRPHGFVAAAHVHPRQEEYFKVISGTITFMVNGVESQAGAGQAVTVPAGAPHAWWNASDDEGRVIVEFRPALKTEELFETFFGLAQDGRVSPQSGLPNLLWITAMSREYRDEVYLTKPPRWMQKVLFGLLGPVAQLLGYRVPYRYPYAVPDRKRTVDALKDNQPCVPPVDFDPTTRGGRVSAWTNAATDRPPIDCQ